MAIKPVALSRRLDGMFVICWRDGCGMYRRRASRQRYAPRGSEAEGRSEAVVEAESVYVWPRGRCNNDACAMLCSWRVGNVEALICVKPFSWRMIHLDICGSVDGNVELPNAVKVNGTIRRTTRVVLRNEV